MAVIMIVGHIGHIDHGTIIRVCQALHGTDTTPALVSFGAAAEAAEAAAEATDAFDELRHAIIRFTHYDEVDISCLLALSVRTDLPPEVIPLYKPTSRRRAWLNDYG